MYAASPTHSHLDISPDNGYLRRKRALRRFRAIVHLVMANLYWIGDPEDMKIGDNVKRNIRLLMRRKRIQSLLTIKEKSILNKPKEMRTDEEKKILVKCISGLRCFRKYPPEVKEKLAAVTYFEYFGPGRIVIKQDHSPEAMYFVLIGECIVLKTRFDQILKEYVTEEIGTIGPGGMFGEVALLHGTGRLTTIQTHTDCEFLKVKKADFEYVLKETVTALWDRLNSVLDRLTYFKNWDYITKRECCIICKTRNFEPNETILGDGVGLQQHVYFVIEGACMLVENMKIRVYEKCGVKTYRLDTISEGSSQVTEENISRIIGKYYRDDDAVTPKMSAVTWKLSSASADVTPKSSTGLDFRKSSSLKAALKSRSSSSRPSGASINRTVISKDSIKTFEEILETEYDLSVFSGSVKDIVVHPSYNLKTHFIKLCEMLPGSCFNVGETFERRRIISLTHVNCLLIPRYWLFKNNADNTWSMVLGFINRHIPNTRKAFKWFVREQKFKKYRKKLVDQILEEKRVCNDNSIHNVPYSIRLKEGYDI
ncbi:uncharacterized protein [Diabrotica undecimpunctata]|uniref:uncharacterized protein n=1 Tax=Diabrotica undecimpunctata TaxID=50387 RepID=UPI003B63AC88